MKQRLDVCTNNLDENGNPAGGHVRAVGLSIDWQNGPLGRGADRKVPNGAFVETVIQAALTRLEWYEAETPYSCTENREAIASLVEAINALDKRTRRRERARVEGLHAGN